VTISADDALGDESMSRALRLLSSEGLQGAEMIIERELEREPDSWEAWAAKADVLYLQDENEESLICCDKALSMNPRNALVLNTKGNALYKLERYDEAIACYDRAIEAEPLFVRAWYNKRMALEVQLRKSGFKVVSVRQRRGDSGDDEGDGSLRATISRAK
jgi:tetratricopeptide (TPR) repeat protein